MAFVFFSTSCRWMDGWFFRWIGKRRFIQIFRVVLIEFWDPICMQQCPYWSFQIVRLSNRPKFIHLKTFHAVPKMVITIEFHFSSLNMMKSLIMCEILWCDCKTHTKIPKTLFSLEASERSTKNEEHALISVCIWNLKK